MKFRLLSGFHHDGSRLYAPGDIVDSETNLVERFANKFARVWEDDAEVDPAEKLSNPPQTREETVPLDADSAVKVKRVTTRNR